MTPITPDQRIDSLHPPFVLQMMMSFYVDRIDPERNMWPGAFYSLMGVETLARLKDHGLIDNIPQLTEKGREWIKKSLSVPFTEEPTP